MEQVTMAILEQNEVRKVLITNIVMDTLDNFEETTYIIHVYVSRENIETQASTKH